MFFQGGSAEPLQLHCSFTARHIWVSTSYACGICVNPHACSCNSLLMCTYTEHSWDWFIRLSSVYARNPWREQKLVPSLFPVPKCCLEGIGRLSDKWDDTWPLLCVTNTWLLKTVNKVFLLKTQQENTKRQEHYKIYMTCRKILTTNWIMKTQRNSPTQLTLFDALRLAEPRRARCIKEFFISNKP